LKQVPDSEGFASQEYDTLPMLNFAHLASSRQLQQWPAPPKPTTPVPLPVPPRRSPHTAGHAPTPPPPPKAPLPRSPHANTYDTVELVKPRGGGIGGALGYGRVDVRWDCARCANVNLSTSPQCPRCGCARAAAPRAHSSRGSTSSSSGSSAKLKRNAATANAAAVTPPKSTKSNHYNKAALNRNLSQYDQVAAPL
jgi:hypothetical protein